MRSISLLVAAAGIAFFTACNKTETPTPTVTTPTNPTTPTNTQGPQPPMPAPSGNNLSGALISLRMEYTTQPAGVPQAVTMNSEMGLAVFYDSPGSATRADAGTVSVNSKDLEKKQDNSYFKWAYTGATPSDLGFSSSSNWNVTGSGAVTAFSYNDLSPFPKYTGTVPSSVTKANGITLTFDNTTLSGTDSVYVVVAAGSQSITRSYAANAGSITITASDLQNFPAVADNTGIIEICPVAFKLVDKNGKTYSFIKEQAIVRNVNIN